MKTKDREIAFVYRSLKNPVTKIAMPALGLLGMGISGYLTYIHYQNLKSICLFNADCDPVLTSQYATIWGVPISLFGLLMYSMLTVLSLWSVRARDEWQDVLNLALYSISLSGTVFSLYLYYLEIFEIHAFCSWCIGSSIVIVSILVCSLINLFKGRPAVKGTSRSRRFKLSNYIRW
ncbi:vitamin K epoxide reductase family protein [Chloroflexota bacterium]